MNDWNKHNNKLNDEEEVTVSFSPVSKLADEEENVDFSAGVSDNEAAAAGLSSERLEKLRAYYANLGQVRTDMEAELKKALGGAVVAGEIEQKLYDFSHASHVMLDELNRLDNLDHRRENLDTASFVGKNLVGWNFSGKDMTQKDFSAANLQDACFSGADLSGADFTGADLSGADLSGANLSYSIFASATLKGTNFTGANMEGAILRDADIEDAILLDIHMDELAIEELQALVEYLAIYYPHKLNLQRINLSLLDLKRIDLRWVNLRGVDFTGIDFTGVNIMELDLSECIITPEQIAQALGRPPAQDEFKRLTAPKNKKKSQPFYIDFSDLLSNGEFKGWIDLTKGSMNTDELVGRFFKIRDLVIKKPEDSDGVIFEKAQAFHAERLNAERKAYNEEQRRNIEERKQKILEGQERASKEERYVPIQVNLGRDH